MSDEIKFVQVVIAQWDGKDGKNTFSTLALGDNGRIYRHDKGAGGWWPLPKRILTPAQIETYQKKKYGAKYEDREGIEND